MKSICVFCGSADNVHADYIAGARWMGRTLAERGIRLIYGGGKTGLMGVVADAVLEAGGEVVGVIIPTMNTVALAHIGLPSTTPSQKALFSRNTGMCCSAMRTRMP